MFVSQSQVTVFSAKNANKENLRNSTPPVKDEKDTELAQTVWQLTNRSSKGLIKNKPSTGEIILDLQGRFQNVMLSKLDDTLNFVAQ